MIRYGVLHSNDFCQFIYSWHDTELFYLFFMNICILYFSKFFFLNPVTNQNKSKDIPNVSMQLKVFVNAIFFSLDKYDICDITQLCLFMRELVIILMSWRKQLTWIVSLRNKSIWYFSLRKILPRKFTNRF